MLAVLSFFTHGIFLTILSGNIRMHNLVYSPLPLASLLTIIGTYYSIRSAYLKESTLRAIVLIPIGIILSLFFLGLSYLYVWLWL